LRICAKCGKANDVTRKYCTRCGASLLKGAEEKTTKPSGAIPEVGRVTTGASLKKAEEPEEPLFSEVASDSGAERTVHASEVSPDRVRTADRHVEKTEYERAQETFASSESASPDERSLRASELRGLDTDTDELAPPESAMGEFEAEPEPVEQKEGKEVVKQILERVKAAEARAKAEAPPPETRLEVEEAPSSFEMAEPAAAVERPSGALFASAQKATATEPYIAPSRPVVSAAAEDQVRDDKVRMLDSDIKAFNIERQQLQSEYDKLRGRLDEEVERYRTVAETKRIRAEGIERELRSAKQEYDDANKEYKNVDNRRKKELLDAEKRIGDVDKRVKKAEEAKEKRIRDLEKERQKREEEARKALAPS